MAFNAFEDGVNTEAYEQRLLSLKEVFVYKVPAMMNAQGHRAEDWGLEKPLFTGLLRIFQMDDKLRVSMYAYKDPKSTVDADENLVHFCDCPIEVKPRESLNGMVDAVVDSGRYFVLRAKDPASSRTTLVGIGFRERETSFDFKNVLNEYIRYIDRLHLAEELAAKRERGESTENANVDGNGDDQDGETPSFVSNLGDLSLKEGSRIVVKSKLIKRSSPGLSSDKAAKSKPTLANGGIVLAPPPPPGSTVFAKISSSPKATTSLTEDADADAEADADEFGDFETA